MRLALPSSLILLSFAGMAPFAPSTLGAELRVSPPVIYDCEGIVGIATLIWSGSTNQVAIRVGTPDGPQMTGFGPGQGFAQTGPWVTDGSEFFLVNQAGQVEASATAHVACGQNPDRPTINTGSSSYFPLAVGNRWVYRKNTRQVTGDYETWTVTQKVERASRQYYVVSGPGDRLGALEMLLREGDDGRIYRFTGTGSDTQEVVFLDPELQAHQGYESPLARYPETVQPVTNTTLNRTTQIFARGVGLVHLETYLMTGSSGGFVESLDLVEVHLPGTLELQTLKPQISLSVASQRIDVRGGNAPNCAVPAYAVMSLGADPPGTYKPCVQVRVSGSGEANQLVVLLTREIAAGIGIGGVPTGGVSGVLPPGAPEGFPYTSGFATLLPIAQVFQKAIAVQGPGEWVEYLQVPLYSEPNVPLEEGRYRLTAIAISGPGPGEGVPVVGAARGFGLPYSGFPVEGTIVQTPLLQQATITLDVK